MFLDMLTEGSTSLLGGFPANLSALPVPAKAKKTKGGSGRNSTALLKKPDPVGALLRTCLVSGLGMQTMSWATWKNPGTPAGRSWWVLGLPAQPINGSVFGWLPTLSATSYGRNKGGANPNGPERPSLETMAKKGWLPTVTACDWRSGKASEATHERNSRPLSEMIGRDWLPTLRANDLQGGGYQYSRGDKSKPVLTLPGAVGAAMTPITGDGKGPLSPCFCEWMMGYPEGWTDVDDTDGSE